MVLRRKTLVAVTLSSLHLLLLITHTVAGLEKLPLPRDVVLESINMKHLLQWSPLPLSYGRVNYSVVYQGEFELMFDSWVDILECQHVALTVCDMSEDIIAGIEYSIRVRAEHDGRTSDWATKRFTSSETTVTKPKMSVIARRESIQVAFEEVPRSIIFILYYWKKREESQVFQKSITSEENPFNVFNIEEGATYCFSAKALAVNINKTSNSTDSHCVSLPGSGPPWLMPMVVCGPFVLVAGLLLLLLCCLWRLYSLLQYTFCSKESLPDTLWQDSKVYRVQVQQEDRGRSEVCDVLQVLYSEEV
ncbi:interleukin-20 receptor subunit beta [Amia ocellicauda]|uniref:interleukin-20 receptor subunit beta n=1 Tax=Amia ocellicauda TaxID=2972642 RepID=UPI003463B965